MRSITSIRHIDHSRMSLASAVDPAKDNSRAQRVHRCRFLEYQPDTIDCLASHPSEPLLAVGRSTGSIEFWSSNPRWHWYASLPMDVPLSALTWTPNSEDHPQGRLFASCIDGTLHEIDLNYLTVKSTVESFGGAVWCMTYHAEQNELAIGCEDGRIRLYSVYPTESLTFLRALVSSEESSSHSESSIRIVSLAWKHEYLFSGNNQGRIQRWHVPSRQQDGEMTVDMTTSVVLWCLDVLEDLTVVSGDSLGRVSIWDGTLCTLRQTFATFEADVLTLVVSPDQSTVFASGIDHQVMQFHLTKSSDEWRYAYAHRSHSHDVRALVVHGDFLLSGGVDTQLVWYPLASFAQTRPKKISPLPQDEHFVATGHRHLAFCKSARNVQVWEIGGGDNVVALTTELKMTSAIVCMALSPDATTLILSTSRDVKIMNLRGKSVLKRQTLDESFTSCVFSKDGKMVVAATTSGGLQLYTRNPEHQTLHLVKAFPAQASKITTLEISPDGQWLVTGNVHNDLRLYTLDGLHCAGCFAKPRYMHTTLGFNAQSSEIICVTVTNEILCYEVETRNLSSWSRENPQVQLKTHWMGIIKGMKIHPTKPGCVSFYSQNFIWNVDFSRPYFGSEDEVVEPVEEPPVAGLVFKKRKINPTSSVLIEKYRPILHLDYLSGDELLVVECPWLKILQRLPDVLYRRKYGQ